VVGPVVGPWSAPWSAWRPLPVDSDVTSHLLTGPVQVKELAELTGATVRTIRYYHQIGLLPVPAVRHGRRDYDLSHVARLVRIRWLTRAGVPLSRVATLLSVPQAGAEESAVTDLRDALQTVQDQLEALQGQREQLVRLLEAAEREHHLSPMPPAIVRFYDELERRTDDETVRRELRHERDFMELAYYRGDMPPEAEVVYRRLDDPELAESLAMFARLVQDPEGPLAAEQTPEQLDQLAAANVARLRRQLGPDHLRLMRSIDLDVARRAAELYLRLVDGAKRARSQVLVDALLAALEQARSTDEE